ncbi:acylphosphatase-2-like [Anopheles darlingi]|nr:acylphosphatase-2-like [Anopheles darlingi]
MTTRMFICAILVTGLLLAAGRFGAGCSAEAREILHPSVRPTKGEPRMTSAKLLACDFEVFGIVQGVFFRKHTQKYASSLGVRGWCKNTADGTVKGQIEGEEKAFNEMKHWLQTKGSPSSRIDKAVFNVPKELTAFTYNDFSIRR